jgi:glutamate--cysteine ligase
MQRSSAHEKIHNAIPSFIEAVRTHQDKINQWLSGHEKVNELPLYSSMDIRNGGFKMAVVDTNLFPAGFNNLCEHGIEDSIQWVRQAILNRKKDCQNILIVAEEHTRNKWYLENIRILTHIIRSAGFNVKIATFLSIQPAFCQDPEYVELTTAEGHPIRIHCFSKILNKFKEGREVYDLIILNNDLTNGIPDILKESGIGIYPSLSAGWHSRLKSHHFKYTKLLMDEFSQIVDLDPWFFSSLYRVVNRVNINEEADRTKLMDACSSLLDQIRQKYKEHAIDEKPYVILKSDSGTYGMGVMPIEDPRDILLLNRKKRNNLYKGKNARVINRFLLQEGIPTIHNINNEASEVCIYQIENNLVGGFYRSNTLKGQRDNLNSKGMAFQKICPHSQKYGQCGVHHDINIFDLYRILARIAAVAAHREIIDLETVGKQEYDPST